MKKTVAVLFGGRSPEHDVSIVSGLQALQALDLQRFDAFPVYISPEGAWYVGDCLRDRASYIPDRSVLEKCTRVTLDINSDVSGRGKLVRSDGKGLFGQKKPVEFDVALLAFHGYFGEDGRIQSLFELANVPYTGMRPLASSIFMDKAATKHLLSSTDIPLLPSHVIDRPKDGLYIDDAAVDAAIKTIPYPAIIKPVRLGSSIGVAKIGNNDEFRAAAAEIFKMDTQAILEPFVSNLVEYNVSVCRRGDTVMTSAIECPKSTTDLLDFREKYLNGGKGGAKTKTPGATSEGMLSLTRDINPNLPNEMDSDIRRWTTQCFVRALGTGAPRIDFLCNSDTGEIWLNEVNPTPGSLAYFLWEAAEQPMLFADLLSNMIDEAFELHRSIQIPADPTYADARIFPRP